MWPFKRKTKSQKSRKPGVACSHCQSTHTAAIVSHDSDQANIIRIWRGQRFVACRCLDCGKEFYAEEPPEGLPAEFIHGDEIIEDQEELQAAEDEVKRQAEEDGDHRCR